jgi:hypothetical protein
MDNYFAKTPRTPTKQDLFIAIMHAKKADEEQPFPSPNILYKLMREVATNPEHMRTIRDGFHTHYRNKRPESYFIIDSS